MGLRARMKDGETLALKAKTLSEALTGPGALTGSLSAGDEVWLELSDGGHVRYSDVARFVKDNDDA